MSQLIIIHISNIDAEPYRSIDEDDDYIFSYMRDRPDIVLMHNPKRGDIVQVRDIHTNTVLHSMIWNGSNVDVLTYHDNGIAMIDSLYTIGDEFCADHWSSIPFIIPVVWIDTSRYGQQILNTLSSNGAYYDTPLGRFHIHIDGDYSMLSLYNSVIYGSSIRLSCIDRYRMRYA